MKYAVCRGLQSRSRLPGNSRPRAALIEGALKFGLGAEFWRERQKHSGVAMVIRHRSERPLLVHASINAVAARHRQDSSRRSIHSISSYPTCSRARLTTFQRENEIFRRDCFHWRKRSINHGAAFIPLIVNDRVDLMMALRVFRPTVRLRLCASADPHVD